MKPKLVPGHHLARKLSLKHWTLRLFDFLTDQPTVPVNVPCGRCGSEIHSSLIITKASVAELSLNCPCGFTLLVDMAGRMSLPTIGGDE